MPTWCENLVTITGKDEDLKIIFEARMSFYKLHPRPKEFDNEDSWLDWNCDNWGVKWDIKEDDIEIYLKKDEEGNSKIVASFRTVWRPPIEFYEYLTSKMSGLKINSKHYGKEENFCGEHLYFDNKMFFTKMTEDQKDKFIDNNFVFNKEMKRLVAQNLWSMAEMCSLEQQIQDMYGTTSKQTHKWEEILLDFGPYTQKIEIATLEC